MSLNTRAELKPLGQLLADRRCRRVLISRLISLWGDFVTPIALAFAVLQTMHGGPTEVGLVLAPATLGVALSTLAGGVLGDRISPARVMATADGVRAGVQLTACVLLASGTARVWELAVLSLLRGLAGGFFSPSARSCWPLLVATPDLQRINAFLGMIAGVAVVMGPLTAAILMTWVEPGYVVGLDGVTFLISSALMATVTTTSSPKQRRSVRAELIEGWRAVQSRRWLLAMIGQGFVVGLLTAGPMQVLGPFLAEERYHGAWGYSTFLGAAGVGAIVAGVVALRVSPRRPAAVAATSLLLFVLAPLSLLMNSPGWVVAVGYFAVGVAEAAYGAIWYTLLQREIPRHTLARVVSFDDLAGLTATPTGALIAGPLIVSLGTQSTLWIAVCAIPIATLPVLRLPEIRRPVKTDPA